MTCDTVESVLKKKSEKKVLVCFEMRGEKSVVESKVKRVCAVVGVKIQDIYTNRNIFLFSTLLAVINTLFL